jgi:hypothetical protein
MAIGKLWSVTGLRAASDLLTDPSGVHRRFESRLRRKRYAGFAGRRRALRASAHRPMAESLVVTSQSDGEPPKQYHLDLAVDDLDAAERGFLAVGATKAKHQPQPDRWRVLLDPAGHPFCVTKMD